MAGENSSYLAWVRTLPCCKCDAWPPNQAHHLIVPGLTIRAHDHDTMPLCILCHEQLHKLSGHFKGWDRERLRAWQLEQIRKTQARSMLSVDDDVF